jgi:hypothetical protein
MEKEINIAEILKDKPQGTKLYDLLRNIDVELDKVHITDVGSYIVCTATNEAGSTRSFGYSKLGTEECWLNGLQILFPSKEMRDWRKFAWKKGDVLICKDNTHIIFEKFEDDTYTRFKGKHYLWKECDEEDYSKEEPQMLTYVFKKANDDDAQTYINTIEEKLGGKLNRETLEIEKTQPEFKDGDILSTPSSFFEGNYVFIFKGYDNQNSLGYYVAVDNALDNLYFSDSSPWCSKDEAVRYATEEEKQQLFEVLAKEGKAWDAEKKAIVDLKPKWTPKPFDRVITRVNDDAIWTANIFSHIDRHGKYVTLGCISGYDHYHCLPYNEETAKLIGTTNNWEG